MPLGSSHGRPQLETPPAGTLEVFVAGDGQMAAFATDEMPAREGCHRTKLVTRGAVRAPNYDRGRSAIHHAHLLCGKVPPPWILPADDYANVKFARG